jgi:pimeloyl-ACP methyl ester carboxylesterase
LVVLLSHGIFGGYDQAYASLIDIVGDDYRKLAPSRFGYPGSDLPSTPTPENQSKAFVALLDELGIKQAFIITTSAGGAAGIKLAIMYPERVKGLILLSSSVPTAKRSREEIRGMQDPPAPLVNDFPMWFTVRYFKSVMNTMFGSTVPDNLYATILPVKPRKIGIKADETITNLDMDVNYDNYPVEKITVPILVVHAKDDPMAKFDGVEKFIARVQPQTVIFETGGHLISGHGDEVSKAIKSFIEK